MMFMTTKVYEGKEKKLRIYFALLLHNRQLFTTLRQIIMQMPHLFVDPEVKRATLDS